MILTRAFFALVALPLVQAACPPKGSGCDFDPFRPYTCGADKCPYNNLCEATGAGFAESDCCVAPQPSACVGNVDPQLCGSQQCEYDNLCIAEIAGYSSSQCTAAPPTCGTSTGDCAGEPATPQKCGQGKSCTYPNLCEAKANGFSEADCCQDTQTETACTGQVSPFSCGQPGGKQCPYDNDCQAKAAGYNPPTQCCPAVPGNLACTTALATVTCGTIPCFYTSQCAADAAGWTSAECCAAPNDTGTCTQEIDPVACSSINCQYTNKCIAQLAGFDPNSCVSLNVKGTAEGSPANNVPMFGTAAALGMAASGLLI